MASFGIHVTNNNKSNVTYTYSHPCTYVVGKRQQKWALLGKWFWIRFAEILISDPVFFSPFRLAFFFSFIFFSRMSIFFFAFIFLPQKLILILLIFVWLYKEKHNMRTALFHRIRKNNQKCVKMCCSHIIFLFVQSNENQ